MKYFSYIALVLAAFLVSACVDAAPDPPAVNPHTVDVKDSAQSELSSHCDQYAAVDLTPAAPQPATLPGHLFEPLKLHRPGEAFALVACACDTSPPQSFSR